MPRSHQGKLFSDASVGSDASPAEPFGFQEQRWPVRCPGHFRRSTGVPQAWVPCGGHAAESFLRVMIGWGEVGDDHIEYIARFGYGILFSYI